MKKEDIFDINFILEEIPLLENDIQENNKLYKKLYAVLNDEIGVGKMKINSRGNLFSKQSISELASVLSKIRAVNIDGRYKIMQAKKSIIETSMKITEQELVNSNNTAIARELLNCIHESSNNKPKLIKNMGDKNQLRQLVTDKVSSGDIALNNNELAMPFDYKGEVKFSLSPDSNEVIATDKQGQCFKRLPKRTHAKHKFCDF